MAEYSRPVAGGANRHRRSSSRYGEGDLGDRPFSQLRGPSHYWRLGWRGAGLHLPHPHTPASPSQQHITLPTWLQVPNHCGTTALFPSRGRRSWKIPVLSAVIVSLSAASALNPGTLIIRPPLRPQKRHHSTPVSPVRCETIFHRSTSDGLPPAAAQLYSFNAGFRRGETTGRCQPGSTTHA